MVNFERSDPLVRMHLLGATQLIMFEQTAQRVVDVITSTQKFEQGKVTIDSTFEELQIDSLDGLNIVFALESEFDIDIPDEKARELSTVRQVAEQINELLESKANLPAAGAPV
ncbi:MAG: phosphopantetheine-binding protein [Bryobacterales bacterium]|nr:phosphopantetheine-binding protein [Bryobacterales bacterium]